MGRKKRKAPTEAAVVPESNVIVANIEQSVPPPSVPAPVEPEHDTTKQTSAPDSSGYAMTSHSGDLVEEDIYVSDGSDDDDDMNPDMDIVLAGSRMGVMRRGLHHPALLQQNRQWVRSENKGEESKEDNDADQPTAEELEEQRRQQEEEELAKLDPVARAARLLAEKQRKLEEAKEAARRLESEENAGRDPCLFSKRTAFDIRMDQIEDKPWVRGAGDLTDFFNYNMTEDDWLEYSQSQLQIRQELTDAARQRRQPDPALVPVAPRAPQKQTPKVAVMPSSGVKNEGDVMSNTDSTAEEGPVIGPALVRGEDSTALGTKGTEGNNGVTSIVDSKESGVKHVGVGGAWGAGAAPGSVLARLIEEQERGGAAKPAPPPPQHSNQQQSQPATTSGQGWAPEGDSSGADHFQDDSYRGGGRGQDGIDNGQDGRNQQWDDRKEDWRHRNDYDRGRYDESRGYTQSYPPQRGGYAPSYGGRGRGGYAQRSYPPHSGMPYQQHWAGRGGRGGRGHSYDYNSRKRHREEYDGNEYRGR